MSQPQMSNSQASAVHTHDELEQLYLDAKTTDQEVFAEMRSNILLVAGDHYTRKNSSFLRRLRDTKDLSETQKLRLTKNHTQRITKSYHNTIIAAAPGVSFSPKNESEIQDQKASELHQAIWADAKVMYDYEEMRDDWCEDFVTVGEVAVKIIWDPSAGTLKGYAPAVDEAGQPVMDEQGQHTPDMAQPVYSGGFIWSQIHGFNLLRAPEARSMKKSPYLCEEKMVAKDILEAKYPDKKSLIQESMDETMKVFDSTRSGYRAAGKEVVVREWYFRPCPKYPQGYYFIETKQGRLEEGVLPGGIFPIEVETFDKVQTAARGRSIVKVLRPYQAEINRSASKMAEHQITLGDDKLVVRTGSKVSAGVSLPGVRTVHVTGEAPTVMPGRDGSQYLDYMNSQITEMYNVAMVSEQAMDAATGQQDPYALLFRAASAKKQYQRYIKRFERFLVNVTKLYIRLAKVYMPEDHVILAVGRDEQVNIAEFKNSTDARYEVKVEPQAEDIETKFGKQLVLNHLLQYVGTKMDREDIGKLIRLMPYGNLSEGFEDLTMDFDAATNDILALDRGEFPPISDYDKHPYMIQRLVSRVRKPDFKYLAPELQKNYTEKIKLHQMAEMKRLEQLKAMENEAIPTGGFLVSCDFYEADPTNPAKTRRVRLPSEAIQWLIKTLQAQGNDLDQLAAMNKGAMAQMAQMLASKSQGEAYNGMSASPQSPGEEMPVKGAA